MGCAGWGGDDADDVYCNWELENRRIVKAAEEVRSEKKQLNKEIRGALGAFAALGVIIYGFNSCVEADKRECGAGKEEGRPTHEAKLRGDAEERAAEKKGAQTEKENSPATRIKPEADSGLMRPPKAMRVSPPVLPREVKPLERNYAARRMG